MLRILMLDLGDTLIANQQPLPHVPEALAALRQFETADGEPLALCLVSDFTMPPPNATAAQVDAIVRQYASILRGVKLDQFFEPFDQHVTLSTQAGVFKPDRRIFELAITRLGLMAGLPECLFITENADHIAAARALGMATLCFGQPGTPGVDFGDWSEAPLLIAQRVDPDSDHDLLLALNVRLGATDRLQLTAIERRSTDGRVQVRGMRWHTVPGPHGAPGTDIQVEIPMSREVKLGKDGRVEAVEDGGQNAEENADVTHFVETLEANGQIAHEPGPLTGDQTHQIETDEQGRRVLKRRRFSAI